MTEDDTPLPPSSTMAADDKSGATALSWWINNRLVMSNPQGHPPEYEDDVFARNEGVPGTPGRPFVMATMHPPTPMW